MPHTSDRKFLEEEVDRLRRRVAELEQQQGQGEVFGTTVNNATEGMPSGNVLSELELHVEQRTTELAKANRKLNEEIEVRKQIAQNLKLSAEIMHNMAEGVCLLRASDGVLVFTNPRFDEIFGYEPGELNGRHTGILNAPGDDTPNEVAEKILQDLQETGNWSGEVQNICKDGTKLWTHSSVSTFEHSQYGMVRVAVVEDITDRKLAEQVAHEKETQLENLLLNVDAIILEGDPFDIYFVGGQVERILGYPKEEWFEHPEGPVGFWSERLHPDDVDKIETCIRAIERGEDHAFEYRLISKDGTSVWFYDSVMVETRDGKPVRTRSVMIDVTARKQAEEALRESEQRFRRVFEDGPIGMALVGVDFQIMEVNPALCQMLGYTAAELLLIDIADITHPDDFAKDLALAEQLVSGAIPMYQPAPSRCTSWRSVTSRRTATRFGGTSLLHSFVMRMERRATEFASSRISPSESTRRKRHETSGMNWRTSRESAQWGKWQPVSPTNSINRSLHCILQLCRQDDPRPSQPQPSPDSGNPRQVRGSSRSGRRYCAAITDFCE
jgi:PAS domain S-box-containing protein